jgi:7-cyano-7-deazaguanine synthase
VGSSRIILLLSGGLDSSVLASILSKQDFDIYPLFVDYGQLSARMELKSCKSVCKFLSINNLKIVSAKSIASLSPPNQLINEENADPVFPNRNLMLLTVASIYAANIHSAAIAIGITRSSEIIYPDCTYQFLQTATHTLNISFGRNIDILAPLQDFTKNEVVKVAMEERIPITSTYSCFVGEKDPCMKCQGCRNRVNALAQIEVSDVKCMKLK